MRARRDLLLSPVFVASVAVLALNDRVLKARWPGVVTGKLSDVAGVVMVAVLATALSRSVRFSIAATTIAFAVLKTVPAVAAWAVPVLGGRTRSDATDLVALAALVPLTGWLRADGPLAGERSWRECTAWLLLPAKVAAIAAAVLVTSATSCDDAGVTVLATAGDSVVALTSSVDVFVSTDGGLTWSVATSGAPATGSSGRDDCTQDGSCFQLESSRGRVSVVAPDGTEHDELTLPEDGMRRLRARTGGGCGFGAFHDVAVVDRPDGEHVVVAMGPAGALHRGVDGRWAWVAVDGFGVPFRSGDELLGIPVLTGTGSDAFEGWADVTITATVVLTPLAVVSAAMAVVVTRRRRGQAIVVAAAGGLVSVVVFGTLAATLLGGRSSDGTWRLLLVAVTVTTISAIACIVVALAFWLRRPPPQPAAFRPPSHPPPQPPWSSPMP